VGGGAGRNSGELRLDLTAEDAVSAAEQVIGELMTTYDVTVIGGGPGGYVAAGCGALSLR
jgi:hypothetical protein